VLLLQLQQQVLLVVVQRARRGALAVAHSSSQAAQLRAGGLFQLTVLAQQ
jgi:hypothetical protein